MLPDPFRFSGVQASGSKASKLQSSKGLEIQNLFCGGGSSSSCSSSGSGGSSGGGGGSSGGSSTGSGSGKQEPK